MELAIEESNNKDNHENNNDVNNNEATLVREEMVLNWTSQDCVDFFDRVDTKFGKVTTTFERIKVFEVALTMYFRVKGRRFKKKSSRYNKRTGKSQSLHYVCYNAPNPRASVTTTCSCKWKCVTGRTSSCITITQWEPIEECSCAYLWNTSQFNTVGELFSGLYGPNGDNRSPKTRSNNSEWSEVMNNFNTIQKFKPKNENKDTYEAMVSNLRRQLLTDMEQVLSYISEQTKKRDSEVIHNAPVVRDATVIVSKKRKNNDDIDNDKSKRTKRKVPTVIVTQQPPIEVPVANNNA